MTTEYLVKPAGSPTWHHVKPCITPSYHKDDQGKRFPLLHYANFEGAIICSAYDEHEVIMIEEGGDMVKHYHVSPREHFEKLFEQEEDALGARP